MQSTLLIEGIGNFDTFCFYVNLYCLSLMQSLLIEGRGRYDCSTIAGRGLPCEQTAPECAPLVLPVEFNKTYRLRIASVASLAPLNIQLEVGFNLIFSGN